MAPNQKDLLMLEHNCSQIMVFSKDGKQIQFIELVPMGLTPRGLMMGGGTRVHGICTANSKVYVADDYGKKIIILDQYYKLQARIPTGNCSPILMCPIGRTNILVATRESFLLQFDFCNLVRSFIPLLPPNEATQNWKCLCTDSRERIIFCDYINPRIRILDRNGVPLHSFSHKFMKSIPEQITTDAYDNILVAHGDQVSIFTPSGQLIPNRMPKGVCLFGKDIIIMDSTCHVNILSNSK